ncbi:hypothetical protein DSM106972_086200 [Dulcicalothrix desertica PCC 7102]|uniref:Uncharacterized protein n=1 Tax=Dulcicalothrix desertica PCC 7102 TaxID=232991 RepID=A0A3S1AA97_9CYAN|nr:hypothetical protein [Dulcicalothrix desertica]RUS96597.1 hypothetical protein DSM106972_086200 [Dulcicalothrix desertica PCC 7102]TWH43849.1 hypothetical protein CAL7102_07597 [Dulcicalothrix desertica PCC 7102]
MTLDKNTIQGLAAFTTITLSKTEFSERMINAEYYKVGTAPALIWKNQGMVVSSANIHKLNLYTVRIKILFSVHIMCSCDITNNN